MFRVLVLQTLYTLSDDQVEYQLRDRLSFMRFVGLSLAYPVPDAKTVWLFREQLVRAGTFERLFERFDAALRERGFLAMGGQIVDGEPRRPPPVRGPRRTIVEARRPRLTEAEKAVVKGGGTPEGWKPARTRQVDRHGRWTLKRGRKRPTPPERGAKRIATGEILVPAFGYKNHLSIDRAHGLIRRFAVSHAAAHDGGQLGAVLDPTNTASQVWAGEPVSATGPSEPANAYRSKANLALLERRGLSAKLQRPKPRGRPMPTHIRRANAACATVRRRARLRRPEAPNRPRQRWLGFSEQDRVSR